jgi:hypothetical protein
MYNMYNIKGNIPDLRQLRSRQGKFSAGEAEDV